MSEFGISEDEVKKLLGSKEIDLFVLRRELQKAEELNAALYLELHPPELPSEEAAQVES